MLCAFRRPRPRHWALFPLTRLSRYDGPLGSNGREAGFLFHSSIDASCIPGVEDSQSLRWRLVAGAICVCSFHAPHVGIALGVRVAFWRNLAATVQQVSQVHSHCSLLLAGDSNIWFPTFELGRVRQTDARLDPDRPGNDGFPWFGSSQSTGSPHPPAPLNVILTTSTIRCPVTVHHGSCCCPVAPLCCPLLASDHMLCSCTVPFASLPRYYFSQPALASCA